MAENFWDSLSNGASNLYSDIGSGIDRLFTLGGGAPSDFHTSGYDPVAAYSQQTPQWDMASAMSDLGERTSDMYPMGSATPSQGFLDTLGGYMDQAGRFMQSPAGQFTRDFLIPGAGGLVSYFDAKSSKKAQEKAMKQQQAARAAQLAEKAKYGDPIAYSNPRAANASWGVGQQAFSDNAVGAMRRMAEGGYVPGESETFSLPHYVEGGSAGQADQVPAMLSDGEFVIDADTVAALGDGNNAAGASALEQMRQNIRKHKRSAPAHKIPPKAKRPEQYLKKGKK